MGLAPEFAHTAAHFPFRILEAVLPVIVADAAAQSHNAQTLPHIHAVVHANASARFIFPVTAVVVAVDIQDGRSRKVRKIFQILLRQIPAGKDQVDPMQPLPCAVIPQCFGGGIRNRKYLHVRNAPFC